AQAVRRYSGPPSPEPGLRPRDDGLQGGEYRPAALVFPATPRHRELPRRGGIRLQEHAPGRAREAGTGIDAASRLRARQAAEDHNDNRAEPRYQTHSG